MQNLGVIGDVFKGDEIFVEKVFLFYRVEVVMYSFISVVPDFYVKVQYEGDDVVIPREEFGFGVFFLVPGVEGVIPVIRKRSTCKIIPVYVVLALDGFV